jgi:hypothetical protein
MNRRSESNGAERKNWTKNDNAKKNCPDVRESQRT